MFHRRSLPIRLVVPVLAIASAFVVFAARRHTTGSHFQQQLAPKRFSTSDTADFRNLSFQPEAGKLSRRLGRRFFGPDSGVSELSGELITGGMRFPLHLVRRQDKHGESVEVTANGKVLAWNVVEGVKTDKPATGFDRSLIEGITFDSADAFILAQLRGASYQVVGRNVRADLGGADNYDGPLWTIVRVNDPDANPNTNSDSSSRLYYINTRTGLLDKVVSETDGEQVEAMFDGWTNVEGETFPSVIRWTRGGRPFMELKVNTFVRSTAREEQP